MTNVYTMGYYTILQFLMIVHISHNYVIYSWHLKKQKQLVPSNVALLPILPFLLDNNVSVPNNK